MRNIFVATPGTRYGRLPPFFFPTAMPALYRFLFVFLTTLSIAGCFFGAVAAQSFSDATRLFVSPPRTGVGAAVVDVDGDGRTDLIAGEFVYLQRNESFVEIHGGAQGVIGALVADGDKDGVREVFFLQIERPGVSKYRPARMAFASVEELPIATDNFPLVQGSVLLDDDRDGHLDILLGNDGPPDVLLRGSGDGRYTDMSASVLPNVAGGTYGMAAADYDRDGDLDVAIGLCFPLPAANLLYRRDEHGYTEVAAQAGVADPLASWGVAWLDYNGDGWLDLYTANMPRLQDNAFFPGFNTLARNNGDGTFTEVAAQAGVAGPEREQSWTAVAADFDNDGWTDLFVANRPEASRLWRNLGDGTFEDRTAPAGLSEITTISLAAGDVNGDGWIDLFAPSDGQRVLFLNQGGNEGWLAVRLRGTASNRDGIGARVEVTAGSRTQVREITGGDGMMSHSHALEAHFGLGMMTEADVTVYWPSGEVTTVPDVAAKQRITIVEGEGRNDAPRSFALRQPLDGADVQPTGTITFGWEAAPDDDPVSYTVVLSAPDSSETMYTTNKTTLDLPASTFSAVGSYAWTVVATDGRSTRYADTPRTLERTGVTATEGEVPTEQPLLHLFPNPSAGNVHLTGLSAGRADVSVFNLLGQQIHTMALIAGPDGTTTLSLPGLPPGTYFLRVTDTEGILRTARFTRIR